VQAAAAAVPVAVAEESVYPTAQYLQSAAMVVEGVPETKSEYPVAQAPVVTQLVSVALVATQVLWNPVVQPVEAQQAIIEAMIRQAKILFIFL